jgi:hypothetical protein
MAPRYAQIEPFDIGIVLPVFDPQLEVVAEES